MWIAGGGVIGGVTTGLIAPHVFNSVAEYPLLIVLAILCLPSVSQSVNKIGQYSLIGGLGASALLLLGLKAVGIKVAGSAIVILYGGLLGLTVFFWQAPPTFAAIVVFLFFTDYYCFNYDTANFLIRNFYGVLNAGETPDGRFRVMWHGTIAQGAQRIRDDHGNVITGRPELISEFFDGAGIAQTIDAVHARVAGPINFAVIGLGTGALTCRAQPGDTIVYYEIDPDVIRVARDPKLFSYISECGPNTRIVQGDARLTLADAPDNSYDLIFIDAFLSAAIPIHLLTREAMGMYLRKINPHGMVAMHVSNRNLELASVVAGIAEANGAKARVYNGGDTKENAREYKWVPQVAAVVRIEEDFGALAKSKFWPIRGRDLDQGVWSDDYSNIFGAMLRNLRARPKPPQT